jgi:O-succinylbenzoic acid--CoA ligase
MGAVKAIVDAIASKASENAFAPALISPMGSISYGELLDLIVKVSNHFDDRRLLRLGRAFINVREPELRFIVTTAALYYGLVPLFAAPETLQRDFGVDFTVGSRVPLHPDIPADIMIDEAVLTGKLADGKRREFPERGDDELEYVTETTGTTGRPKLVAVTHKAHLADVIRGDRRFAEGERVMFAMGGISRYGHNITVSVIISGGALVGAPTDAIAALKAIALFEVSYLLVAPMTLERMLDVMERHNLKAPSVKRIGVTGSVLSERLLRRIEASFDAEVSSRYGTSEAARLAAGVVTSATFRRGYVGHLIDGATVVTAGTREAPAPIVIANSLARQSHYLVEGKLVADARPTITLPDLGYVEDGALFVVGRADEVFNFSGNKIAYDDIQREVERQPGVLAAALVGCAPIGRDEDLVVGVVGDRPLDLAALSSKVLGALDWAGATEHFHFLQLPQLPMNQMGKLDRPELLRMFVSAAAGRVAAG